MGRLDPASRRRLEFIGIDVWCARPATGRSVSEPASVEISDQPNAARIRLSSGNGDWLLVQQDPWRGAYEALLSDITATIGVERVRFGQWARGSASGETVNELASRGIRRILSLGPAPDAISDDRVILAPSLDALAADGAARKSLWQALAPHLSY